MTHHSKPESISGHAAAGRKIDVKAAYQLLIRAYLRQDLPKSDEPQSRAKARS